MTTKTKRKVSTFKIEDGYRQKADRLLRREGYTPWWVPRTKIRGAGVEKDIFGVFDGIAVRGHLQRYVQLGGYSDHAKHRKKILDWVRRVDAELPLMEIWSWHEEKQAFLVEVWVYNQRQERYWMPWKEENDHATSAHGDGVNGAGGHSRCVGREA
jgi:hypothetical protein